ncbi:hypothetical protein HanIR_Chr10g0475381 [Helianthus annuus]|nr:hypothetical protein HanIR_Chr10g0475381 [Helianthus annuus]
MHHHHNKPLPLHCSLSLSLSLFVFIPNHRCHTFQTLPPQRHCPVTSPSTTITPPLPPIKVQHRKIEITYTKPHPHRTNHPTLDKNLHRHRV